MDSKKIIAKVKEKLAQKELDLDNRVERQLEKGVDKALKKVLPKVEDEFEKTSSMDQAAIEIAQTVFNNVMPFLRDTLGAHDNVELAKMLLSMVVTNQLWRGMGGRSDLNPNNPDKSMKVKWKGSRTFLKHMSDLLDEAEEKLFKKKKQ